MPHKKRWSSSNPVEPKAGRWKIVELPDPRDFELAKPPANNSPETQTELEELHQLTSHRTAADIEQILHWSVNEPSVNIHWDDVTDEMCRTYRLTPPAGARVHFLLSSAIYCAIIACWDQKWRYLRPRPTDLDPTIDISVIPVPQHPSYPAGHSTVAGAARMILSHLFPADAERFHEMAESSGISRLKAGIHYRSDHTAGLMLGDRVARTVLRAARKDGAPSHYER